METTLVVLCSLAYCTALNMNELYELCDVLITMINNAQDLELPGWVSVLRQ